MKRAVIFAGAPTEPDSLSPVPEADCYICADAGVRLAQAMHIHPNYVVGDFDSLGSVPDMPDVDIYPAKKDDTDTILAAKYALEKGCRELVFYGALGGRLDHTIANLQMLRMLADQGAQGILVDSKHWVTLQRGGTQIYPRREKMYFSLFAMTPVCEDVTLKGVAYPLTHGTLYANVPLGVSNEIVMEYAVVSVGKGDLLVIFARD